MDRESGRPRSRKGFSHFYVIARTISACLMLVGGFFGFLFYKSYLKWITLFENGRYFDPVDGVVHHESAFVWGAIALIFLLTSASIWLISGRVRTEPSR